MPPPLPSSAAVLVPRPRSWRAWVLALGYLLAAALWSARRGDLAGTPTNPDPAWLQTLWLLLSTGGLYLAARWCARAPAAATASAPRRRPTTVAAALPSFAELAQRLPDAALMLRHGQITWVNPAAVRLLDTSEDALIGHTLHDVLLAPAPPASSSTQVAPTQALASAWSLRRGDGAIVKIAALVDAELDADDHCRLLLLREFDESTRMRDALAERNAELHALTRRLFSLQEDERRVISRDLHDDIGQTITAIKLSAHAALEESDVARRHEDLLGVVQLADSALIRLRNLSMLLRPPQLDALGLEAALRWQAATLLRASSVRLLLEIETLPCRPGQEVEQACFRIAQESLTNALRHASPGQIVLSLHVQDEQLALRVSDDGDGFDPAGPRGLGLIFMRERAQSAGGTLRIESAPGAGTRISLRLPYPEAVAAKAQRR